MAEIRWENRIWGYPRFGSQSLPPPHSKIGGDATVCYDLRKDVSSLSVAYRQRAGVRVRRAPRVRWAPARRCAEDRCLPGRPDTWQPAPGTAAGRSCARAAASPPPDRAPVNKTTNAPLQIYSRYHLDKKKKKTKAHSELIWCWWHYDVCLIEN